MSSIIINGRTMDAKALSAEAITFTDMLAKTARLDEPLPVGCDLSESDDKEVQTQLQAMYVLPQKMISIMWAAFCAKHVSKLAKILRELSLDTQPKAFSTYIQILSLFGEASREPYYRMFLTSPDCEGLTNVICKAFVQGVKWRHPSGPGFICGLIIELLFWCNTAEGDDKKSAMDADLRKRVAEKIKLLKANNGFSRLGIQQRADIERLDGILNIIEEMPEDFYLRSTRDHLLGQMDCCGNEECAEEPTMRCARCKTVEYCGKECQAKHWKGGHKVRCFTQPFVV